MKANLENLPTVPVQITRTPTPLPVCGIASCTWCTPDPSTALTPEAWRAFAVDYFGRPSTRVLAVVHSGMN